ncbi:MAG: hypothetical protein EOL95_06955 [Bacteroidia bacterium]|nr:hypothetical protein [Bacteroidia bacterium]
MRKLILTIASIAVTSILFAQIQTNTSNQYYNNNQNEYYNVQLPISIKSVSGPNKEVVNVFCITYNYPSKSIENAILERLKKEGLDGKKMKNNFYAFKGVKYNYLWNRTFDFYISVIGSQNAGTVNLLISQGYDNFIDTKDYEIQKRASDWLTGLDIDIQRYIHTQTLNGEIKELEAAQKDLKKLNKEKSKIESKIAKKDTEKRTFEAKRTVPDQNNMNNIDPNILEKEQKQANDIEEDRTKLDYELKEIKQKIEAAETHVAEHEKTVQQIKSAKP